MKKDIAATVQRTKEKGKVYMGVDTKDDDAPLGGEVVLKQYIADKSLRSFGNQFFSMSNPHHLIKSIKQSLEEQDLEYKVSPQNDSITFSKQAEMMDEDDEVETDIDLEAIFPGYKQDKSPEVASVLAPDEVSIKIQLLRVSDSVTCVSFLRMEGASILFYQTCSQLRSDLGSHINSLGPEEE